MLINFFLPFFSFFFPFTGNTRVYGKAPRGGGRGNRNPPHVHSPIDNTKQIFKRFSFFFQPASVQPKTYSTIFHDDPRQRLTITRPWSKPYDRYEIFSRWRYRLSLWRFRSAIKCITIPTIGPGGGKRGNKKSGHVDIGFAILLGSQYYWVRAAVMDSSRI